MPEHTLYPHGRLSAPLTGPHGEPPPPTDYELIAKLRAIRANGDEELVAIERYDPDFSVKLSACADAADAECLLAEWFERRMTSLRETQAQLRTAWNQVRGSK